MWFANSPKLDKSAPLSSSTKLKDKCRNENITVSKISSSQNKTFTCCIAVSWGNGMLLKSASSSSLLDARAWPARTYKQSLFSLLLQSKTLWLTLSQTSPCFYVSAIQVFTITKEKLLVTSNISFSPSVLYPFGELISISIKFNNVVCKLFQFQRV